MVTTLPDIASNETDIRKTRNRENVMMSEWAPHIRYSVRTEVFQISFAEPFRVVFIYTLILLEAMCLLSGASEELWLILGCVPVLTAVLSAVAIGVLCWRYKFSVAPEGLACYDFWCRPLRTNWDSIVQVRRFSMLGLTYLRLKNASGGKEVWLPLFVDRYGTLLEIVTLYAGESHPISIALQAEFATQPQ